EGFAAPRYTAALPSRSLAYVTDSARQEVVAVDVAKGEVVSRTEVPGPARHVSISPNGSVLWTSLGSKAEADAVLDLREAAPPRLVRTLSPPFLAHDVLLAPPDGRRLVASGARPPLPPY